MTKRTLKNADRWRREIHVKGGTRGRGKGSYYRALQRDFAEHGIVGDILPWEHGGYLLQSSA